MEGTEAETEAPSDAAGGSGNRESGLGAQRDESMMVRLPNGETEVPYGPGLVGEKSMKEERRNCVFTPAEDGFWMPGEFERHDGCIMIWPKRPGSWNYGAVKARQAFREVAYAIGESETVYMLAAPDVMENAREVLFGNGEEYGETGRNCQKALPVQARRLSGGRISVCFPLIPTMPGPGMWGRLL